MENKTKTVGQTTTEGVGVTETQERIGKLNPLKMSDDDFEFANEETNFIRKVDYALWKKSCDVVSQLGLGGLWRGNCASILIVANAIKEIQ